MNILLTNDDGFDAVGIATLHEELSLEHKVFLVAPKSNCSGMSAAISLRKEIKVEAIDTNIYAVSGTPADCSYLGLLSIISEPIDMIVSGINLGANLGEDIFYSGTIGAAIAGRRLNHVPIAFSIRSFEPKNLNYFAQEAAIIINQATSLPEDKNLLVNVNFPDLDISNIKGKKITKVGKRGIPDTPDLIRKEDASCFYSFGSSGTLLSNQMNTDVQAVDEGYISISILDYNLTAAQSSWQDFEDIFINE